MERCSGDTRARSRSVTCGTRFAFRTRFAARRMLKLAGHCTRMHETTRSRYCSTSSWCELIVFRSLLRSARMVCFAASWIESIFWCAPQLSRSSVNMCLPGCVLSKSATSTRGKGSDGSRVRRRLRDHRLQSLLGLLDHLAVGSSDSEAGRQDCARGSLASAVSPSARASAFPRQGATSRAR